MLPPLNLSVFTCTMGAPLRAWLGDSVRMSTVCEGLSRHPRNHPLGRTTVAPMGEE